LAVVRSVAALGAGLGMSVTVEGVETPEQLAIVRREGCDEVQGYLFGRPSLADELPDVIERIDRGAELSIGNNAA